jgi:cysteine-rich repeat protein
MLGDNCGNGRLDPGEECDDGNILSGDGCSEFCKREVNIQ